MAILLLAICAKSQDFNSLHEFMVLELDFFKKRDFIIILIFLELLKIDHPLSNDHDLFRKWIIVRVIRRLAAMRLSSKSRLDATVTWNVVGQKCNHWILHLSLISLSRRIFIRICYSDW